MVNCALLLGCGTWSTVTFAFWLAFLAYAAANNHDGAATMAVFVCACNLLPPLLGAYVLHARADTASHSALRVIRGFLCAGCALLCAFVVAWLMYLMAPSTAALFFIVAGCLFALDVVVTTLCAAQLLSCCGLGGASPPRFTAVV